MPRLGGLRAARTGAVPRQLRHLRRCLRRMTCLASYTNAARRLDELCGNMRDLRATGDLEALSCAMDIIRRLQLEREIRLAVLRVLQSPSGADGPVSSD